MKREPQQQLELAVRMLKQRHIEDVLQKAFDIHGRRGEELGPIDPSRNLLDSFVARYRVYRVPPLVSGLTTELAAVIGDYSARTTIEDYSLAGGHPMPTVMVDATAKAIRFERGAGYAGVAIGDSRRSSRLTYTLVTPDDLKPEFHSDDPSEPTCIRRRVMVMADGKSVDAVEVYDLTDLKKPSFKVFKGADWNASEDITEDVHGQTYSGDDYAWRYADGTPFHRIVLTGHPDAIYRTNPLVEATLFGAVRWTVWGFGLDMASYGQRHVRGLAPVGADSAAGEVGVTPGFERVIQWHDIDADKPGDHWQDKPAFDPLTNGKALRVYESSALSMLGIPVDYEATGGEPTATEQKALAEEISTVYPEQRRFVSELLRRSAAIANRLQWIPGESFSEDPYGVLFREEVEKALTPAAPATPTPTPDPDPDE